MDERTIKKLVILKIVVIDLRRSSRPYPKQKKAQLRGDEAARQWVACFQNIARLLHVKVPDEPHHTLAIVARS